MASERIVVVGASAGGVRALQVLASSLPAAFPAPILVVQHIGANPSILPQLLTHAGPLPAAHGEDGEALAPGRIRVAPPDHHMLVEGGRIRLSRGPKEQYARPAIDPLFRSAAVSCRERTIGVLLTGALDDGTAGLQDIKSMGGIAVVQEPRDAEVPSMPESALRYVDVDHRAPVASIGPLLASLAAQPACAAPGAARRELVEENEILLGKGDFMEHLRAIAAPSTFTCPECHGALWEVKDANPRRFRCHTGHGFSLRALQHAQGTEADEALWSAMRALQEKQLLLESLAAGEREAGDAGKARRIVEEAERVRAHGEALRRLIESLPSPRE